ncbi:MAG: hypothetical protein V1708_01205, partial [Candidatus Micrarchaeota archaeon]
CLMQLEELQNQIVAVIQKYGAWGQVVSIDLETKVLRPEDFLSNERVLAAGISVRGFDGMVHTQTATLEEDSDESEFALMEKLGRMLEPIHALVLAGYNISGYDFPLLCLKLKRYDDYQRAKAAPGEKLKFPREYWALKDALTRAYILDIMHVARFKVAKHDGTSARYLKLKDVIAHPMFSALPLMKKKDLGEGDGEKNKGEVIYGMWKDRDARLVEYLEGDVHDTLLIAEELFKPQPGAGSNP